jgi:hypothetical protein
MGWAYCGEDDLGRPIGYGVPAHCDNKWHGIRSCFKRIDRGLSYVCGDMHGGGEYGCGRYFCYGHLNLTEWGQLCEACTQRMESEVETPGPQ